ncbi:MAG: hypothetical protein JNM90_24120 [Burkholderiales bacterium]|nr:hypothetical protein [Burkholderiales bacterium]
MAGTWTAAAEHALSRASLAALLDNRIAAIRIPGFATPAECAAFARAARAGDLKYYSVEPPVGYIGMAQYEYRWDRPKADYFADVPAANARLARVTAASFDPVARVIEHLAAVWDAPVGIGREEGLGEYYAGIVRIASQGIALHADFAPINSPAYAIGRIDAQLGWNFFAEDLPEGGETTVHNAPWNPVVAAGVIPQSYNLPREVVAGAPSFTYAPTAGDVVLFNSRNPHEIAGGPRVPGRDRIGIGSFIGRMPDRSLVLWS